MRTIIHISDLHYGKTHKDVSEQLVDAFSKLKPDLVVISGDLTQRAKTKEFESAKSFLQDLKKASLSTFVIPGNHDIEPLFKPLDRISNPYKNYKEYISSDLEPVYYDKEIAIAAINTVKSSNIKNGGMSLKQVVKTKAWFSSFPRPIVKIVVTHHPIDLPLIRRAKKLVPIAAEAVKEFSRQDVDLYLSGHYHRTSVVTTSDRFAIKNYSAIALQAGTLSIRERGEAQSFNVITIDKQRMTVETYRWNAEGKSFRKYAVVRFKRYRSQWQKFI